MDSETVDKPEWFRLEKYNQFKSISSKQWAYQLVNRRSIALCVFSGHLNDHTTQRILFEDITINPLLPEVVGNFGSVGWAGSRESTNKTENMFQQTLQPLTFNDLSNLLYSIPEKERNETMKSDWKDESRKDLPVDNIRNIPNILARVMPRDEDILNRNIFHICIDLDATDQYLMDDFKRYLKAAREAYSLLEGSRIKTSRSLINRLISAKIIPYLDLIIWAEIENISIPQHIIGDWLFPNQMIDVAEKIRKVTRPLAERSLSSGFINTLSSLPE
jgi:hypothetical protein